MTQTVLLGDVCIQLTDGTHSTVQDSKDGSYYLLSAKNVKDRIIISENERRIDSKTLESLRKRTKTEKNDVLVTSVGTIGETAIVEDDFPNYEFQRSVLILKPNTDVIIPKYLYYYMRSLKRDLVSMATGAVQKCLFIGQMKSVSINLPDLETQNRIADILGKIDEKIDLNRQMNEVLEQTGQALFRHYFINNSEPADWKMRELGEFFPIRTGKKDANFGTEDGQYPFFTCAQTISKAPDYSFDAHALLLAGNGDFNIKLFRGKFEAYQRTYVLIPNDERFLGIMYFLMSIKLPEITGGSRGSVIKFITKGMIENYKFVLPDDERLLELATIFNQITINIEENVKQAQTLTTLRDTLLPRLVSGEIKINGSN